MLPAWWEMVKAAEGIIKMRKEDLKTPSMLGRLVHSRFCVGLCQTFFRFLTSFKFSFHILQSSCTFNILQKWNKLADVMIQLDCLINRVLVNEFSVVIKGEENNLVNYRNFAFLRRS
jgi:hypothetical protein